MSNLNRKVKRNKLKKELESNRITTEFQERYGNNNEKTTKVNNFNLIERLKKLYERQKFGKRNKGA